MDKQSLSGKVALVTGAASGIGRATAMALAEAQADVALVDRNKTGAEETAESIRKLGRRSAVFELDLFHTEGIPAVVEGALGAFGRIDVLVNAAGIADNTRKLLDPDDGLWDRVLTVNLKAPYLLMQHAARHMIERGGGGRIVNVSSSSSFRGSRTWPAYSSSKAGLNQLTRTASAELGPHDINVNAVVPGITKTAMIGDADYKALVVNGPLANFLGRISEAEDVANVILFLCLPASRQITGQTIHTSAGAVL